ncbi:hypothetical protein V1387_08690 [Allomuricauda taeanensis]|uniref:hypothetical protein n=1 Tax=Flagellimonas taeanensis TaxID=1005926 RepID=UPI002E7C2270|nr:hypothetical protein [Allomuricauda taeanensis]MEE1962758.1 hypothetical protein [Allomuricauda taeanensis]
MITTAALTALITTLAHKGFESAFEKAGEKISEGAINWLKSLLYKDNSPKKALKELQENPEKEEKQLIVKSIIENSIEDNATNLNYLREIIEILPVNQNHITNYKNINTGQIKTRGGDVNIGDKYDK